MLFGLFSDRLETPCVVCGHAIGEVTRGNFLILAKPSNLGKCMRCIETKK